MKHNMTLPSSLEVYEQKHGTRQHGKADYVTARLRLRDTPRGGADRTRSVSPRILRLHEHATGGRRGAHEGPGASSVAAPTVSPPTPVTTSASNEQPDDDDDDVPVFDERTLKRAADGKVLYGPDTSLQAHQRYKHAPTTLANIQISSCSICSGWGSAPAPWRREWWSPPQPADTHPVTMRTFGPSMPNQHMPRELMMIHRIRASHAQMDAAEQKLQSDRGEGHFRNTAGLGRPATPTTKAPASRKTARFGFVF